MVVIDQVYVLEGIELQGKGVTVAHAAVKASACVPMCMMDSTDQDVTLYKGTRVVTLAEAETPGDVVQVSAVQKTESMSAELEAVLWGSWWKEHPLTLRNRTNC